LASRLLAHSQLSDQWAVQEGYDQLRRGHVLPSWLAAKPAWVWQSSGAPAQRHAANLLASPLQGPTILDRQSCKTGFWQGPLEPLSPACQGKGKQGALCRLCRVIVNATTLNLGAAPAPC